MFRLAGALDPASMRDVARRAYAEMAAAGYGAVGEFHYVHHQPDGTPYDEPNELAIAVAEAAIEHGPARSTLLAAAYHRDGWDGARPPAPAWAAAVLRSVGRRVPRAGRRPACLGVRARRRPRRGRCAQHPGGAGRLAGGDRRATPTARGLVRHVHAHEQRRELVECEAEHGCTPIELLARTGFLGPRTSVVHGIHVTERDIELLADTETIVVTCPTTEGNLGDGHLPAMGYRDAGVRLAIGSDSQVRIDPFEEVRELETGARRERQTRHALLAVAERPVGRARPQRAREPRARGR